jgi:hypothetical protein
MEFVHSPLVTLPQYRGSAKKDLCLWLSLCLRLLIPSRESISMDVFDGWVFICLADGRAVDIVSSLIKECTPMLIVLLVCWRRHWSA